MTEMSNSPETSEGSGPARRTLPATPRWVKILGIVALVVIVLVLIIVGLGIGGEHGPGRHNPSGAIEPFVIASK